MAQDTGSGTAEILHTATVVLTIVTLTALAALACILLTWATAHIVRRRRAHQRSTLRSVKSDTQSGLALTADFNSAALSTLIRPNACLNRNDRDHACPDLRRSAAMTKAAGRLD